MIYSKDFDLIQRPKFTGWEQIEKTSLMNNEVFSAINDLKTQYNGVFEMKYNLLIQSLTIS